MSKKPTVLLVEDDIVTAETYKAILTKEPIKLIHFKTGEAVLKYLQKNIPQAIVLDLMLPDMNGIDILKYIEEREINCPIIMITAQPITEVVVQAMHQGAIDFLEKPVNPKKLLATLQNALQRYHSIKTFEDRSHYHGFLGTSKQMRNIYHVYPF